MKHGSLESLALCRMTLILNKHFDEEKNEVKDIVGAFKAIGSQMAEVMKAIGTVLAGSTEEASIKENDLRLERLEEQMKEQAELASSRAEKNEKALALILSKL